MGIFLDTLNGQKTSQIPIWFMRQAGRYLPEYRKVRQGCGSFLDLCYNSELACEVTLQPIRRFDFNASILFSDILVIPDAMGQKVEFVKGEGPKLEMLVPGCEFPVEKEALLAHLKPVFDTVSLLRARLPEAVDLIGFAGAPWTVACYMVQGGGSKDFGVAREVAYEHAPWFAKLVDAVTEATIHYLRAQIDAGAQAIQLFDSWAGMVSADQMERYCIEPAQRIREALKESHPDVPFIAFPKGVQAALPSYIDAVQPNAVGIDFTAPLDWVQNEIQPRCVVQGNLDPTALAGSKFAALMQTNQILEKLSDKPFVFNLGHGILPHTPIENVQAVIDRVREVAG